MTPPCAFGTRRAAWTQAFCRDRAARNPTIDSLRAARAGEAAGIRIQILKAMKRHVQVTEELWDSIN
jgi:hypothetical protein